FKLTDVIKAIIVMRILVQFVGQAVGLILLRYKDKKRYWPFKMRLFPIPALLSIAGWMFMFLRPVFFPVADSAQSIKDLWYIAGAVGIIALGAIIFFIRARSKREWPFEL